MAVCAAPEIARSRLSAVKRSNPMPSIRRIASSVGCAGMCVSLRQCMLSEGAVRVMGDGKQGPAGVRARPPLQHFITPVLQLKLSS